VCNFQRVLHQLFEVLKQQDKWQKRDVCNGGLEPSTHGQWERSEENHILLCISECVGNVNERWRSKYG